MTSLLVFIFSVLLFQSVSAEELSLLEDVPKIPKSIEEHKPMPSLPSVMEEEDLDEDFEKMDDFVEQESEKLKVIKLLNLDLERASLELKKREIEQKISALAQAGGSGANLEEGDGDPDMNIKLLAVFVSESQKQAIVSVNGNRMHFQEGQAIEGLLVKAIQPQGITLEYPDGQTEEILL